jgi:phage FluMu gp28-like protein
MLDAKERAELLAWLARPENFASSLVKINAAPLTLDAWQEDFLRDESKFINILKSRRIGGSFIMTLKMFVRSQLERCYSGTFISMNLEEAKGKIEYANAMYDSLPRKFRKKRVTSSRTELVFADAKGNRSVLRSLASKAPRGRGGDVGISELPHCQNSRDIYQGALHVTSRSQGDRLVIESTPLGSAGIFYDIAQRRYSDFSLYEVPWWMSSALCSDVKRAEKEAPNLSTRERVEGFGTPSMRAIFKAMPEEAFQQESELKFLGSGTSVFQIDSIRKNSTPDFGLSSDDGLRFRSVAGAPPAEVWNWLEGNIKGSAFAGFDVGRVRDESALVVMDETEGRLECRLLVRLPQVEFATQENIMGEAIKRGIKRLAIDSTGIGLPLAERLKKSFGEAILPIHFTAQSKTAMVNGLRMLFSDSKILLPLDRAILAQLSSIDQKVTESGNLIFCVKGSSEHHADTAWALMLACACASAGEVAARSVSYERIAMRGGLSDMNQTDGWRW